MQTFSFWHKKDRQTPKDWSVLQGLSLVRIESDGCKAYLCFDPSAKLSPEDTPLYLLTIYCCWRLVQDEKVLLDFQEVFHPPEEIENDPTFDLDDWIKQAGKRSDNWFCKIVRELYQTWPTAPYVESIVANKLGDVCISLSEHLQLQLFADGSTYESFFYSLRKRHYGLLLRQP